MTTLISPRAFLKQYTAKAHETLERVPCHTRLLDVSCQKSDYIRVLQGYAQAIATVEPLLLASHWHDAPPYQARLPKLQQDLMLLNAPMPIMTQPLLSDDTLHNPWGLRYVIDGMTLGSRWMAKHTQLLDNSEWQFATSFFTLTEVQWPLFCQVLDHVIINSSTQQQVAISANVMFERFLYALTNS